MFHTVNRSTWIGQFDDPDPRLTAEPPQKNRRICRAGSTGGGKMASLLFKFLAIILAVFLTGLPAPQISYGAEYPQAASGFNADELDQMLAPIALYPDPLLAQILPAASFVDQITQAQRLLNGKVDEGLIESQPWDISVKAIAHYPEILNRMLQNPDWTVAVGQAYVTQPADIESSIQRLRAQAQEAGVLQSTPQQQVIAEPDAIRIEPAQAEFIYVPEYNPGFFWGSPGVSGAIGFGSGLLIGSWLNRDWDWHGRGPYYHGWSGGGWIDSSRRHVDMHNRSYVNDQFRNINVNRNVVDRNISGYRQRLDREAITHQKPAEMRRGAPFRSAPEGRVPAAGAPTRPGAPRSVTPAPAPGAPHGMAPPQGREKPQPVTPRPGVAPRPVTPPATGAPPRTMAPPQGREKPQSMAPPQRGGAPSAGAPQGGQRGTAPRGGGRHR
jgi:hypothetical protein